MRIGRSWDPGSRPSPAIGNMPKSVSNNNGIDGNDNGSVSQGIFVNLSAGKSYWVRCWPGVYQLSLELVGSSAFDQPVRDKCSLAAILRRTGEFVINSYRINVIYNTCLQREAGS
ncbi:hypothetical protein CANTEDRAFT_114094 [Yamadazyma tenuis ATCC 10573]|uniref:Uncharacterized protein n=1 Tax=Candida tenuis (strain ATCC 10573 / BCRC 21748 / CBS 615 / JCM 9827 / NBRC 10315 / NRRL Y-1498 / VKM Y-70) TaxID=590646 RepID=G3B321_CANTC|nr:uncharacterized protein CANTEDRAFT_114094 [Yamadazyma tenuis ATCC 10573]EGV64060.1 hypothetical protein CANTEDRAFT_114094 [Yamadazyma tenuis ATCC 10573]